MSVFYIDYMHARYYVPVRGRFLSVDPMPMLTRHALFFLLALSASMVLGAPNSQTYSDVAELEDSGDLVGTELTLRIAGEAVTGTLRHYEGVDPEPITLSGQLQGNDLKLRGSYSEGDVEVYGRLDNKRFLGKLSYHLGSQTNELQLNLSRVARPRMPKS